MAISEKTNDAGDGIAFRRDPAPQPAPDFQWQHVGAPNQKKMTAVMLGLGDIVEAHTSSSKSEPANACALGNIAIIAQGFSLLAPARHAGSRLMGRSAVTEGRWMIAPPTFRLTML
jgi:hypothetical protein